MGYRWVSFKVEKWTPPGLPPENWWEGAMGQIHERAGQVPFSSKTALDIALQIGLKKEPGSLARQTLANLTIALS